MCQHEQKYCPSCHQKFECKVGSIHLCQCSAIKLTEVEKNFIQSNYDDCLCISCLLNIEEQLNKAKN
ncbi:MAG: cysteine-rich CWC family protein [Ferruginibacter sp.]|nr:cysteine-rich CWC family protein [Ferruginibacter sp.]